ncbi:helix-turn-helix domain-containing protein [Halorhabdus amylolytica]|uniref:helix-turn-helix domain-containing protein n=1 Tax=Halorhabdus amylolytica TaxID=2559573 RepID=UPI0010A9BCD4|nr:helix-turn-helix domain-containing protein [Halorhabdus amylolytica]
MTASSSTETYTRTYEDDTTTHEPRLISTEQQPAATAATVTLDQSPSNVWATIATADGFQEALKDAVRTILPHPRHSPPVALEEAGVTALDGGYARIVAGLDRAPETDVHQDALDLTAQLGQDGMTSLGHAPIEAVEDGPVATLQAGDVVPTIEVRVPDEFKERSRDQRETTLDLLATLALACEVHVVAGRITTRWLAHKHRDELPTEFSERATARGDEGSPSDEVVTATRSELDPDGRVVEVLRRLAAEPSDSLSYHEIKSSFDVTAGRISQVLGTLEELDLAQRYGPRSEQHVELLPAGSAFLDALDAEIGRQADLDSVFSEAGQDSPQAVLTRGQERSPTDDVPFSTAWLARQEHAPAAATATEGAISLLDTPIPADKTDNERRIRYVSYDSSRDEAVVAVRATGPLNYMTSTALALASPRFIDAALPPSRLEAIDEPEMILRNARHIGGISSEAADDGEELRDRLVEWGEELAQMTTDLHNGEYEDRNRFRGQILSSAHGLAGSLVHLLDAAGVDLVREFRLPGGLDADHLEDLAETIATGTAIQSAYGVFGMYRQLFETREEKRQTAISPDVDPTESVGEYIGSLVVRGPDVHRFEPYLEDALADPADVHDDAPEIQVRVPIRRPDRTDAAETATRVLGQKNLKPTRDAVTILRSLTDDPYAIAEALNWLGTEDHSRDVRLDEVRVALSKLGPDRLLPDAPPTASKAVATLLRMARPLTQSELAEKADVSTRSLRRHMGTLELLDLVRETERGYRIALPDPDDERGQRILPEPVEDDLAAMQDYVFDAAFDLVEDPARLTDPGDSLGAALSFPPDFDAVAEELPRLESWIPLARQLCDDPDPDEQRTVTMGPEIEAPQTSLDAAAGGDR